MAVRWDDAATIAAIEQAAKVGIYASTEAVRTEMLRLIMRTRKTGRWYRRRGRRHRASAPGEAPASDTGRLVGSIHTDYRSEKGRFAKTGLRGEIKVTAKYGAFLEYGTRKMRPRPFARTALANKRAFILRTIAAEIKTAIRRRTR